jgi:hypothetical protein
VRTDHLDLPFRIGIDTEKPVESLLHIVELRLGLDAEIACLAVERSNREQMEFFVRNRTNSRLHGQVTRSAFVETDPSNFLIAGNAENYRPDSVVIRCLARIAFANMLDYLNIENGRSSEYPQPITTICKN